MAQYFGSVPFSVGELVTVTDPNDAAAPNKRAVVPSVTIATASGGTAFGSGTSANQVQGTSASGVADDGSNPVKVGGVTSSATPTAVADGQRINDWRTRSGATVVAHGQTTPPAGSQGTLAAYALSQDGSGRPLMTAAAVWDGSNLQTQRGDTTGAWTHNPPSSASNAPSGTIAASGGTAAVTMTNNTRSEVINPSTATLWASWGTPAVNGAGSFPIISGGSYNVPDRAAGTLTLLSTAANQPYTVNRFS